MLPIEMPLVRNWRPLPVNTRSFVQRRCAARGPSTSSDRYGELSRAIKIVGSYYERSGEWWRATDVGGMSAKPGINMLQVAGSAARPPRIIKAITELESTFPLPAKKSSNGTTTLHFP
jgi:hypothetical protein